MTARADRPTMTPRVRKIFEAPWSLRRTSAAPAALCAPANGKDTSAGDRPPFCSERDSAN